MKFLQARTIAGTVLAIAMAGGVQGAIILETGDAGQLPGTAQAIAGGGPSLEIQGNLLEGLDVDMFRISIADPLSFFAVTLQSPFLVSDPQLFLFDSTGAGVYMNDDGDGLGSQSELPALHPFGPLLPGIYYLAIGWFDNEPMTAAGRVFEDGMGTTGPNPLTAGLPVTYWNDDFSGRIDLPTDYVILVEGITAIPEPSTVLSLGLGLIWAWKYYNRRRQE